MAQASSPAAYACTDRGIAEIISSIKIEKLDSENVDAVRGLFELDGDAGGDPTQFQRFVKPSGISQFRIDIIRKCNRLPRKS